MPDELGMPLEHHVNYWALSPSVYVEDNHITAEIFEVSTQARRPTVIPIVQAKGVADIDTMVERMRRNMDMVTTNKQFANIHVVTFVTNPGKVAVFALGPADKLVGFLPAKNPSLQGVAEEAEILADLDEDGPDVRLVRQEPEHPEIEFTDRHITIDTPVLVDGFVLNVKMSNGDTASMGAFELTEGMDVPVLVARFKDEVRVYEAEMTARGFESLGNKLDLFVLHFVKQNRLGIMVNRTGVEPLGFSQEGPYIEL